MTARNGRKPLCMVLALVSALALTACSEEPGEKESVEAELQSEASEETPTPGVFEDYDAFAEEYVDSVESLTETLPEGATFTPHPVGDWDPEGQYEAGAGQMHAAFQWQCAWIVSYEDAKAANDQKAMTVALDRLEGWANLAEVAPHTDDASRVMWEQQVIAPARAGDDAFLVELGAGC